MSGYFKNITIIIDEKENDCEIHYSELSQAIFVCLKEDEFIVISKPDIADMTVINDKIYISGDKQIIIRFGSIEMQYNFVKSVFPEW